MPLTEKKMTRLKTLAEPYLGTDEELLTGATGTVLTQWWQFPFSIIGIGPRVWHLLFTNRRLLAVKVEYYYRERHLDTLSVPWSDVSTMDLRAGFLLNSVRFSTRERKSTGPWMHPGETFNYAVAKRGNDLEALRAAAQSVRPDLQVSIT
jgi:hypothetical protein